MLSTIYLFISSLSLDAAVSSNLMFGFQDPATPIAEGFIDLHHHIMFFLIIVVFFVFYMIDSIRETFAAVNFIRLLEDLHYDAVAATRVTHGVTLEIVWTLIPTAIFGLIALPSFSLLYSMDEIISPDLTIKVIGHQWYWSYEYDLGLSKVSFDSYMVPTDELSEGNFRLLECDNFLVLPAETHIRVIITSGDVLHCWAIPSFGIKMDAVPGRLNQVSLYIKREGLFFGQCSELCGVNHGFMPIEVLAIPLNDFNFLNVLTAVKSLIND